MRFLNRRPRYIQAAGKTFIPIRQVEYWQIKYQNGAYFVLIFTPGARAHQSMQSFSRADDAEAWIRPMLK